MLTSDEIADYCLRRFDSACGNRGQLETLWERIARIILPSYADSFGTPWVNKVEGMNKTDDMVDATGALALTRFGAVMESMLAPQNSQWHGIEASDPALMRDRQVRLYCEEATRALFRYRYASKANFIAEKQADWISLGAFGSGAMFIDKLKDRFEKGLRYRATHLGEVYFFLNHQGRVDTVIRKFSYTARQAIQAFAADRLPPDIKTAAESPSKCENLFEFLHCIHPREEDEGYDPQRIDVYGMPFAGYYISKLGRAVVEEEGYFSFPYAVSRYITAPREVYGRSPAMLALPALQSLNEMKKTNLKQGHRAVDPPLLVHDDGVIDNVVLRNGGLTWGGVNAEGRPLVHALPVGNLAAGKDQVIEERGVVNDLFLVSLFQILIETPAMTATEVLERAREKGMLLSPTMGRQQAESLGPMIERELDVLAQQKLLPEKPPLLIEAGVSFQPVYTSPLSRAQRAEEVAGLFRSIDWAVNTIKITQDPSLLDHVNFDIAFPEVMQSQAVPERWQHAMSEVKKIRQGRMQQRQQQQLLDAAPALASAVKTGSGLVA